MGVYHELKQPIPEQVMAPISEEDELLRSCESALQQALTYHSRSHPGVRKLQELIRVIKDPVFAKIYRNNLAQDEESESRRVDRESAIGLPRNHYRVRFETITNDNLGFTVAAIKLHYPAQSGRSTPHEAGGALIVDDVADAQSSIGQGDQLIQINDKLMTSGKQFREVMADIELRKTVADLIFCRKLTGIAGDYYLNFQTQFETISLHTTQPSLGFAIVTQGNSTIIEKIVRDSVAAADGRLKKGDQLLSINGRPIKGLTSNDVVNVLRACGGNVSLYIKRSSRFDYPIFIEQNKEAFHVTLPRDNGPLGINICTTLTEDSSPPFSAYNIPQPMRTSEDTGLYIREIVSGSPADDCGKLMKHDEIVGVNGKCITHLEKETALEVLQKVKGSSIHITLVRQKATPKKSPRKIPGVLSLEQRIEGYRLKQGREFDIGVSTCTAREVENKIVSFQDIDGSIMYRIDNSPSVNGGFTSFQKQATSSNGLEDGDIVLEIDGLVADGDTDLMQHLENVSLQIPGSPLGAGGVGKVQVVYARRLGHEYSSLHKENRPQDLPISSHAYHHSYPHHEAPKQSYEWSSSVPNLKQEAEFEEEEVVFSNSMFTFQPPRSSSTSRTPPPAPHQGSKAIASSPLKIHPQVQHFGFGEKASEESFDDDETSKNHSRERLVKQRNPNIDYDMNLEAQLEASKHAKSKVPEKQSKPNERLYKKNVKNRNYYKSLDSSQEEVTSPISFNVSSIAPEERDQEISLDDLPETDQPIRGGGAITETLLASPSRSGTLDYQPEEYDVPRRSMMTEYAEPLTETEPESERQTSLQIYPESSWEPNIKLANVTRPKGGSLGMQITQVTGEQGVPIVIIQSVSPDGAAARSGIIAPWDRITQVDKYSTSNCTAEDFVALLGALKQTNLIIGVRKFVATSNESNYSLPPVIAKQSNLDFNIPRPGMKRNSDTRDAAHNGQDLDTSQESASADNTLLESQRKGRLERSRGTADLRTVGMKSSASEDQDSEDEKRARKNSINPSEEYKVLEKSLDSAYTYESVSETSESSYTGSTQEESRSKKKSEETTPTATSANTTATGGLSERSPKQSSQTKSPTKSQNPIFSQREVKDSSSDDEKSQEDLTSKTETLRRATLKLDTWPEDLKQLVQIEVTGEGLTLGVGLQVPKGDELPSRPGLVIWSTNENGLIATDGRIEPGDYLVGINGESMTDCERSEDARSILQNQCKKLLSKESLQNKTATIPLSYVAREDAEYYIYYKQLPEILTKRKKKTMSQLETDLLVEDQNYFDLEEEPPSEASERKPPVPEPEPTRQKTHQTEPEPKLKEQTESPKSKSPQKDAHMSPKSSQGSGSPKKDSDFIEPNFDNVTLGRKRFVEITREPSQSLGLSIVDYSIGIIVRSVMPGSPADFCSGSSEKIEPWDRLTSINGKDLTRATREEAIEIIRQARSPLRFIVQPIVFLDAQSTTNQNKETLSDYSDD